MLLNALQSVYTPDRPSLNILRFGTITVVTIPPYATLALCNLSNGWFKQNYCPLKWDKIKL
jgi:hypothetical protein